MLAALALESEPVDPRL
nr:hypothetical protein [Paenibacillus sp. FSL H7-0357]